MNTNTRSVAVATAVLVHIAALLPKVTFKEEWRSAEGGYDNIELTGTEIPENELHAAFDTDGRVLLVVNFQGGLHVLYQSTERDMLLYAGDNQKLCEVMEITGPEISLYSLMLLFSFFGPETVVTYLSGVMSEATQFPGAGNGGMEEVTDTASDKKSDTAAPAGEQSKKKEELDPELRKRVEDIAKIGVFFIAGVIVGAVVARKLG